MVSPNGFLRGSVFDLLTLESQDAPAMWPPLPSSVLFAVSQAAPGFFFAAAWINATGRVSSRTAAESHCSSFELIWESAISSNCKDLEGFRDWSVRSDGNYDRRWCSCISPCPRRVSHM